MKTYTPTIGLEIHAELKTKTKMFCASKNDPHHSEPNVHVCPICMGHPGTLPVINETAVMHVLSVGKAMGGTLATYTEFDRKNYFYPDIPKGYQISQYAYPLVTGGVLNQVAITRIHLEEDTARSLHDQGDGSIVDYNRAGVPLMELVTEPVIKDAKTAGDFARELQLLLRTLEVSDANMEKGEMRIEANVSVSSDSTFGTKVEVKNLNSFKSVEGAIAYEIKRQIQVLEEGGKVVQETRGWDEAKGRTFSQRTKETAHDYRYFPDPDLPKLEVDNSRVTVNLDSLPWNKREKYKNLGLTKEQIGVILFSTDFSRFYDKCLLLVTEGSALPRLVANYLTTDFLPQLRTEGIDINACSPESFVKLAVMADNGTITSRVAKDILFEVTVSALDPERIVEERGLRQATADDGLIPLVEQIISQNQSVVDEYKAGKATSIQFLIGQGMRLSKGTADPARLLELLKDAMK